MLTAVGIFGAGLLMAIVTLSSALFQGKVCANGIAAIGNGNDVMGNTLILAAFPELYAILGVAATFLISGAIDPAALEAQRAEAPAAIEIAVEEVAQAETVEVVDVVVE